MQANSHCWINESIAKQTALLHSMIRVLDLLGRGFWPIEKQFVVLRPHLHIPGHRLVVKVDVFWDRAEEHMQKLVLFADQLQFVLIAKDLVPTMRSLEGIANVRGVRI